MYGRDHQNIVKQLSSNFKKKKYLKKKKKAFTCAARRGLHPPRRILNIRTLLPFVIAQAILPHQKEPCLTFSHATQGSRAFSSANYLDHQAPWPGLQRAVQRSLDLSCFTLSPDRFFAPSTVARVSSASLLS